MQHKVKLILTAWLLLSVHFLLTAKTFDWQIEYAKINTQITTGDFKNAKKTHTILLDKIYKQFGADHAIYAAVKFQEARIYNGLGQFPSYNSAIEKGTKVLNQNKGTEDEYVLAATQGAQALVEYGNPKQANELLSKSLSLLNDGKIELPIIATDVRWVSAQILLAQGYYAKIQPVLQKLYGERYAQIITSVEVKDAKTGKVKINKLSTKEVAQRKRNYAEALNMGAEVFLASGDYISADSMTKTTEFWIKQQLGGNDFARIKNLYQQGQVHAENHNLKKEYNSFNDAMTLMKSSKGIKYGASSSISGLIYEKAILSAKKILKYKEATKIKMDYTAKWKRAYGRDNFYRAQLDLLEANRQIIEQDYTDAEKELSNLVSSNSVIPATHLERVKVLHLLNVIYEHNDAYDDLEKNLLEIIRIKKELVGEQTPAYHQSMLDLADFYVLYTGKLRQAEDIYKNSLEKIVGKEIDYKSKYYINNLYNQSKLYQITDKFGMSQAILNKVSDRLKSRYGVSHPFSAEAQEKLAALDIELGKYNEARTKLESAIAILKSQMGELDVTKQYTEALEALALLQMLEGNYNESRKTLQEANKLIRKEISADQQKSSAASEEMFYLNIYTGQYQGTEKKLKQSIVVRERRFGNKSRTLITPYNQLGELYVITGDFTDAEKVSRRSSIISKAIFGDSSLKYSESLSLLEKIYSSIGDYEKAEGAIRKVLAIQKDKYGANNYHVAQSLNRLALIRYYNKGSAEEIESNFKESLKIIKSTLGEKNPEYAEVLKNLALYYIEAQRIAEATPLLNTAFTVYLEKFGKENIHTAEILILQGNIQYFKKNYTEAKNKYTEAGNIYLKIFDIEHPNYVRTISLVGQMNYILGDYKTAVKNYDFTTANYLNFIKRFFPALSEREKTKYWNLIKNDFEFYNTLAVRMQAENPALVGNMYNFALNTKAILLNSTIKVRERILASKDPILITKYEEFVSKKEFMASAISMSTEERKSSGIDIKNLEKEIESSEKELSASSELFVTNNERNNVHAWEKIKEVLKPNEIAVEVIRYRKYTTSFSDTIMYAMMVITPETKGQPQLVLLENGADLEKRNVKYYRNAIKLKLDDQMSYSAFWAPMKKYVKENTTVYFSADGVYNQINLETLLSPEGKSVIDHNEIVMISSTRDLIKKKIAVKKKDIVVEKNSVALFGNPSYYSASVKKSKNSQELDRSIGEHIDQLPGAEKEVKEIFGLLKSAGWQAKLYLENNAEEDSVKSLKNPKVFHIATHGFFMEDAQANNVGGALNEEQLYRNPLLRSGLLLRNGGALMENANVYDFNSDDGILTAYEAMNLNFDKTDLVVLSACETGLGELQLGEGVYGLQRSFLVAGSQSIVMSLFKVNDEVTQELMMSFYKKWLKTADRRKSFLEAKKEIKLKYKDPLFWGSFVMVGL